MEEAVNLPGPLEPYSMIQPGKEAAIFIPVGSRRSQKRSSIFATFKE